jgi:hypothetical protein
MERDVLWSDGPELRVLLASTRPGMGSRLAGEGLQVSEEVGQWQFV